MSRNFFVIGLPLVGLLVRKLESKIVLVNWRSQRRTSLLTSPKHEVGSKLRTACRSYRVGLFLLCSKCRESWCHETLRLRARLVPLVRKIVFLYFTFFSRPDTIFCILYHCSEVRRKGIEIARKSGCTQRSS